jgi:hypothetical protein
MPYHDLGLSKYSALYQKHDTHVYAIPDAIYVEKYRNLLRRNNVRNVV